MVPILGAGSKPCRWGPLPRHAWLGTKWRSFSQREEVARANHNNTPWVSVTVTSSHLYAPRDSMTIPLTTTAWRRHCPPSCILFVLPLWFRLLALRDFWPKLSHPRPPLDSSVCSAQRLFILQGCEVSMACPYSIYPLTLVTLAKLFTYMMNSWLQHVKITTNLIPLLPHPQPLLTVAHLTNIYFPNTYIIHHATHPSRHIFVGKLFSWRFFAIFSVFESEAIPAKWPRLSFCINLYQLRYGCTSKSSFICVCIQFDAILVIQSYFPEREWGHL